ncbi:MAG: DUF4157 domain-containing protein [Myxococcota bacterium]
MASLLRQSGRALDESADAAVGFDLSRVRVHDGPEAERAATSLNASAFTLGRHIVLGETATPQLLKHEARHAVQQGLREPDWATTVPLTQPGDSAERAADQGIPLATPLQVARQTAPEATPANDFATAWQAFDELPIQWASSDLSQAVTPEQRLAVARRAAAAMTQGADLRAHGVELADWFYAHGHAADGQAILTRLNQELTGNGPGEVGRTGFLQSGPQVFIERARRAARGGRHAEATDLFTSAWILLQNDLLRYTERRRTTLSSTALPNQAGDVFALTRIFTYLDIDGIYDEMRDILGFYEQLAVEAHADGRPADDAAHRARAVALYQHIRDTATIPGQAMIAEVRPVTDSRGNAALRLYGQNSVEEDLTQLPGLDPPSEVGRSTQYVETNQIADSLMAQAGLLAEVQRHPEVQSAFRRGAVDPTNAEHRIRLFGAMYRVFQRVGGDATEQLMIFVGRVLQAFTTHTEYNIRDFGRSYLRSDMPVDLMGRVERDCGVYALTVAYELFRTARVARPRLDLAFELISVPAHVMLVIFDRTGGNIYLVNNNEVSPPLRGTTLNDANQAIARAIGGIQTRNFVVTPAVSVSLGNTRQSRQTFERRAWARYQDAAAFGLEAEPLSGPTDTRSLGERTEAAHRAHYAEQEQYDQAMTRLHPVMEALSPALTRQASADRQGFLRRRLDAILPVAGPSLVSFLRMGPSATSRTSPQFAISSSRPRALRTVTTRYYYGMPSGVAVHPLVRVAMALRHLEGLGATLTTADTQFLQLIDRVQDFQTQLAAYVTAGRSAPF